MKTKLKTMKAWVAWVNTDLTEGRGGMTPLAVCETETTARRIGKGRNVQGCNADIEQIDLLWTDRGWFGPVGVHGATREDTEEDAKLARKRAALERAKALGLSEQEVKDLYATITQP